MTKPLIVAHRGFSSKFKENTLEAFKKAFEANSDFVEGDFWLSKDNQIICIHDETTNRITNSFKNLNVTRSNLVQIKIIKINDNLNSIESAIPIFEEVIDLIPPGKGLFLEVKDNRVEFIDVLNEKIKQTNINKKRIVIISYFTNILKYSKSVLPEIETLWILDSIYFRKKCKNPIFKNLIFNTLKEINCDGINLSFFDGLNPEFIQTFKNNNFKTGIFNVNSKNDLKNVLNLQVDYITTDDPTIFQLMS